jgi:diacylglycerol kinase family enzyme
MAIRYPDGSVVDDSYLTLCLNTNPYTFLGNRPLNVAPDAGLDRGLAVVGLRTLSFLPTMSIILSVLGTGTRARKHPKLSYRHDLTSLRVEGYGPFPYQVDGDYLGEAERLELAHEPDVLRLVIP